MKLHELMTTRPLTVGRDESPEELRRLMDAAQVHHLPLVDGDRLVGLWLATDEGPIVLLGPEQVHETTPDADVDEALQALMRGCEAVFAWRGGEPAGLLTRADVLRIARAGLAMGAGRRHPQPVVLRLVGPAGSGKTTLVIRTIPLLRRCEAAILEADTPRPAGEGGRRLAGARVIEAPEAHWAHGLQERLADLNGVELVIVEDRVEPGAGRGAGEDLRVLVVPAGEERELDEENLREAQAVVLTKLDAAPPGFTLPLARGRLRGQNRRLSVFGVAAARDDRGLQAWRDWLERQVLPRRH